MGLLGSDGLKKLWTKIKNLVQPYIKDAKLEDNVLTFTKGTGETSTYTVECGYPYVRLYSDAPNVTKLQALVDVVDKDNLNRTLVEIYGFSHFLLIVEAIEFADGTCSIRAFDLYNGRVLKTSYVDPNVVYLNDFLNDVEYEVKEESSDDVVRQIKVKDTSPGTYLSAITDVVEAEGLLKTTILVTLDGYFTASYLVYIRWVGDTNYDISMINTSTLSVHNGVVDVSTTFISSFTSTDNSTYQTQIDDHETRITELEGNGSSGSAEIGDTIFDLGTQSSHKDAQQAMVDYLMQKNDEKGCYLFKYYCSCYGNACFAIVRSYDGWIEGTVYDNMRSFRQFQYKVSEETYVLDGCWLPISSFSEENNGLATEQKNVINAINELNSKIGDGSSSGGSSSPMTGITYSELKALRDDGSLEPGMFYLISDYVCTTSQPDTRAMNHSFHIIVQALNIDTLSEIAKADFGGDTYFRENGANLPAWEIKYCLDNDTTRFAWAFEGQAITNLDSVNSNGNPLTRQPACDRADQMANEAGYFYAWGTDVDVDDGDSQNFWYSKNETLVNGENVYNGGDLSPAEVSEGKGVIYYMKDEHGNECPYDFKNIQFKRMVSLENGYPELDEENGEETWVYTFCGNSYHKENDEWSEMKDGSLESPYYHQNDEGCSTFHHNVMGAYIMAHDYKGNEEHAKCGKQYLNNNVFIGYWEEVGSSSDTTTWYYAFCPSNNKLGDNSFDNTFLEYAHDNTITSGRFRENNVYYSHNFIPLSCEYCKIYSANAIIAKQFGNETIEGYGLITS